MAYTQLQFRHTSGRESNLAALIWNLERMTLRTSGTTMTAIGSVADATFAAGRLTASERATSDLTGTGVYVLSEFPALTAGYYIVEIYDVTTPSDASPGPTDVGEDVLRFSTLVYWNGTDLRDGVVLSSDAVTEIQSGLLTSVEFAAALPANFADLAIEAGTGEVTAEVDEQAIAEAVAALVNVGTPTDVEQEPVPTQRTFILVQTANDGLRGEGPKSIYTSEEKAFAISFRNDLPVNGRILIVNSLDVISGPAGGIVLGQAYRDHDEVKFTIDASLPGSYTIRSNVTYDDSANAEGQVLLNVEESA